MHEISMRRLIGLSAWMYVRRAFSSLPAIMESVCGLIVFAMSIFLGSSGKDFPDGSSMMGLFFVGFSLSRHWKQQLIVPWARLWPRFRIIQTCIFICLIMIPLAVYFLIALAHSGPGWAFMVLAIHTLAVACLLGMTIQIGQKWWGGFNFVLWIALILLFNYIKQIPFWLDHHGLISSAIFVVAAGYASWLIYSLLKSDDQTPGFSQDPFGNAFYNKQSATTSAAPQQQMLFVRWLLMPSDRQVRMLHHPRNSWQKIFRWRIGMMNVVQAAMLFSGWLLAGAGAIALFPAWKPFLLGFVMFIGVMLPVIFMGTTCTQYLKQMPFHIVLPVRRGDYFKEWMLAFSLSHLTIWVVFSIALSMSFFIIFKREDWYMLPMILLISFGINIFYQGVILWLSRMSSMLASFVTFFPAMLLPSIFIQEFRGHRDISWTLIIGIFTAMTLLGCMLGFDAYRRWLKTEVGLIGAGWGMRAGAKQV